MAYLMNMKSVTSNAQTARGFHLVKLGPKRIEQKEKNWHVIFLQLQKRKHTNALTILMEKLDRKEEERAKRHPKKIKIRENRAISASWPLCGRPHPRWVTGVRLLTSGSSLLVCLQLRQRRQSLLAWLLAASQIALLQTRTKRQTKRKSLSMLLPEKTLMLAGLAIPSFPKYSFLITPRDRYNYFLLSSWVITTCLTFGSRSQAPF